MNLTIFVEQVEPEKYRAETTFPVLLSGEGRSRDEAIERVRQLAERRLANGELVEAPLKRDGEASPWTQFAGIWKDHPEFDEFVESVAKHRQQVDKDAQ